MHIAMVADGDGGAWLRRLTDDGVPTAEPEHVADMAAAVADVERSDRPRWIQADLRADYPRLLAAGVRLDRCVDVRLTEAILLSIEGHCGEPHSLADAYARLHHLPIPDQGPAHSPATQDTLFETDPRPEAADVLDRLVEVYRWQRKRHTGEASRLLTAAESAGGLIAAEMTHHGLPWRTDVHDAVLTELLGPRPVRGLRPAKLQRLADKVSDAFGHPLNPDSPQQVLKAFKTAGHELTSTRAWELKRVDHPAVAHLLSYKELARVHSGHGWSWAGEWVGDGPAGGASPQKRLRPEYVVGGVVTGRWATNGGAALQIPRVIRKAVTADDGWRLVVADAAQLEPRMLAAMSGDRAMAEASRSDDLYAALAPTFDGSRDDAKIALLSAMYGGTAGNASALLVVMRRRFPQAYGLVEEAAVTGERGGLVRTWLGRTSPPPSPRWWNMLTSSDGTRAARDRGRFTRNFIVQGTAAEWALAMMALLRRALHAGGLGHLVFFQHDEIIVHCPEENAAAVTRAIADASDAATALLFGDTSIRVPLAAKTVRHYSDAKE